MPRDGRSHGPLPSRSLLRLTRASFCSVHPQYLTCICVDHSAYGIRSSDLVALPELGSVTLLWSAYRPGMQTFVATAASMILNRACFLIQLGIVTHPDARRLEKPVNAIVAGSAPTAHLIGELEKKNIHVVHVYGLTYVSCPYLLFLLANVSPVRCDDTSWHRRKLTQAIDIWSLHSRLCSTILE